jgi:hypothetical protein
MTQQNDASAEEEFLFYLNEDNNSTIQPISTICLNKFHIEITG